MAGTGKGEGKVDRRVLLTKGLIKEAFLELKRAHALADIKVTDLCERAGIGRGTFYRHYRNMTEVLEEVLDEALSQSSTLAQHLVSMQAPDASCAGCDMPFCRFVRENRHYAGIFMDESLTGMIVAHAVAGQKERYKGALAGRSALADDELDEVLRFQMSGCLAAVRRHVDASPAEWQRVQRVLDAFVLGGTKEALRANRQGS